MFYIQMELDFGVLLNVADD